MPSLSKIVAALATGAIALADAKACPPLGAVFLPPQTPSTSSIVKQAASQLKDGLDSKASALFNSSALSIGVKSIHEDDLLFNYHFTPNNTGLGVDKVDENTVYRIGSGSKLFTVLAALKASNVHLDDPILKYLPQLRNTSAPRDQLNAASWEEITVGALASHLSGIGPDLAQDIGLLGSEPWAKAGLPPFAKGTGPDCSGLPGTGTELCSNEDLLREVGRRPLVYSPYTVPVYSNIGISLLGLVVEAATKKPIGDVIKSGILDVVGMNNTYFGEVPPTEDMFVPEGDAIWNSTLGVFDSAGGMYSTVTDLLAFAEAILDNKLLSPVETRKWLKPAASTSSLGYLVGHPWEILRSDNLTSDGRVIDIYTKSGDLGLYHSLTVLVPDYDIVVTILMGGKEVSQMYTPAITLSAVLQAILPAVEAVGRQNAHAALAGRYVDESTNSSISLTTDNGPGLVVSEWTMRGFSVLNHTSLYSISALETLLSSKPLKPVAVDARLYPTGMRSGNQTAFRGVFDVLTAEDRAALDRQIFFRDGTCESMFAQDKMVYNYLSIDEFVFTTDGGKKSGEAKTVRSPAFNVTLTKVSASAESEAPVENPPVTSAASTLHGMGMGLAALMVLMSLC